MTNIPAKVRSSWGCVQALLVTLAILFLPFPVSALETGIDLIKALDFESNHSHYKGISVIQGYRMKQAYNLSEKDERERNLILPKDTFKQAIDALRHTSDFTFAATLRQIPPNCGSIISFADGVNRYLELQSSGRRGIIRFHYTYTTADGGKSVHAEEFTYQLADSKWHQIAISVSGKEIELIIDCQPLYKRVTHSMPDRNFSASNMHLFLGQRNLDGHNKLRGDIEEALIVPGPYGYLKQCPHLDSSCPTCGQFSLLQQTIYELKQNVNELRKRLVAAENRVTRLEDCDCKKSCKIGGVIRDDGDEWNVDCDTCKCEFGNVTCGPKDCGKPMCKYPVAQDGECCPKCLKKCFLNGKEYEHGERSRVNCNNCTCIDGSMSCPKYLCPELRCPKEQRRMDSDNCCQYCPGDISDDKNDYGILR